MALNWVEVDAGAIRNNLDAFGRRVGPRVALGAVVKSNAYGHGMLEVARIASDAGATWLCVNNAGEGSALRAAGFGQRILVMGYVPLDELDGLVEADLEPVVYNVESVEALAAASARAGKRTPVHLKAETGTNRQGVPEGRVPEFVARLVAAKSLALAGLTTHFANIEDTTDHAFAESQIAAFKRIDAVVGSIAAAPYLRHVACSAAAALFDRTHLDLVRVGISLYGVWSSKETYVSCLERGKPSLDLRPALTWKTKIAQIKEVPEGAFVGYGCTFRTTRPSRIAVLPVGYYEGYDRGLSGVAHVLIRGKRAPVRGRVCMNMCMVDVTDLPEAGLEDEVVLLGKQGDERVAAEQLATWCGTIPYEVLSRIHPGLPRIVHG